MPVTNVKSKWSSGSLIFYSGQSSGSVCIGEFSSSTANAANMALSSSRTKALDICADDGAAALTAGSYQTVRSRVLLAKAIASGDISVQGLLGQCKVVANVASTGYLSGVRGYVEVSGASVSSCAGVRGMVDVPSGATIAASNYASAFMACSNDLGGTHTGKAVVMHVPNPVAGTWDAYLALDASTGCIADSGAGGATSKYLKVLLGGVAYSILVKSDA
jgi:hypothetical protein